MSSRTVPCVACRRAVDAAASICPHCRSDLAPRALRFDLPSSARAALTLPGLVLGSAIFSACNQGVEIEGVCQSCYPVDASPDFITADAQIASEASAEAGSEAGVDGAADAPADAALDSPAPDGGDASSPDSAPSDAPVADAPKGG